MSFWLYHWLLLSSPRDLKKKPNHACYAAKIHVSSLSYAFQSINSQQAVTACHLPESHHPQSIPNQTTLYRSLKPKPLPTPLVNNLQSFKRFIYN